MSRFIVISTPITDKNQFKTANIPLPKSVKRVKSITVVTSFGTTALRTTRLYSGKAAAAGVYNQAFVLALTNRDYIKSRVNTITYTPAVAEYIFVAWPSRLGLPTLVLNNDSFAMENPITISMTDPDTGYVEDYYLLKSVDDGDGTVKTITVA